MGQGTRKLGVLVGGGALAALLLAGIALFVVAPKVADDVARERLERIHQRTGWTLEYEKLRTVGLGGVEIEDLRASTADGAKFLSVKNVSAHADLLSLLRGDKRLSELEVSGVTLHVKVLRDGSIHPLNTLKRDEAASGDGGSEGTSLAARLASLPDVGFKDVSVEFSTEDGARKFPLTALRIPAGRIQPDDGGIHVEGTANVEANEYPGIVLPTQLTGSLDVDSSLRPRNGTLEFDRPLVVSGVGPLPFVTVGLSGAHVEESGVLGVSDFRVAIRDGDEEHRLFDAKKVGVALEKLTTNLDELRIAHMRADGATLFLDYDERGASALQDVWVALRAPAAGTIVASAQRFAEKLAEKNKNKDLADLENGDEPDDTPSSLQRLEALLKRWAPHQVTVSNVRIEGNDKRTLELDRFSSKFTLENGNLVLEHEPGSTSVIIKGGFEARGDGAGRGKGSVDLSVNYGEKSVSGAAELDGLDLSWVGQVLGKRFRRLITGGTLRAKLDLTADGPGAFTSAGFLSVEDTTITSRFVALEPLEDVTASYSFESKFDANAALPATKLIDVPLYETPDVAEGEPPPPSPPEPKGSLVFRAGTATFNGVKATFRPSFFGFNAPGRLPARMDLHVELPKTDVKSLFDAVPKAIQGPAAGTKMEGTFSWLFDLEIPLYRASDMKWDTQPKLEDFRVVEIPKAADVRRLLTGMDVTITDSIEKEDDFERTVTLPPAKPTPVEWLLENSGLTIEEVDERRRKRDWPEIPTTSQSGLSQRVLDSPELWSTPYMQRMEAPRPWNDGDAITGITEERPLGRYVFVPIQYISPYMPRAVMTTEDNSFFTHSGFNLHALRASIERNIEAGGFKRGASTIAMQMVKNVFLHRKKVISRKIQEAFLVFLMETAVDVPKSRIMEVYLNVIEFGPGIFGIHDAAVHYFGKRPDQLTIAECAWFVSIIPNPKKYHFYYERGQISDSWFRRMKRYIQVMHNRERITEEELAAAQLAPPEFYKPEEGEPLLRPVVNLPFNMLEEGLLPLDEPPLLPGDEGNGPDAPADSDVPAVPPAARPAVPAQPPSALTP